MIHPSEFHKEAVARSTSILGALAGAGKWIHDLPKHKEREAKQALKDLLVQAGGGAVAGAAAGKGVQKLYRRAGSSIRKQIRMGLRQEVEAAPGRLRKKLRGPLKFLLPKS